MSDDFKKMQILRDLSVHDPKNETLHQLEFSDKALSLAKELPTKNLYPKMPGQEPPKSEALLLAMSVQREWDASRVRGIPPQRAKPIPQVTANKLPELSDEKKERLKKRPRKV